MRSEHAILVTLRLIRVRQGVAGAGDAVQPGTVCVAPPAKHLLVDPLTGCLVLIGCGSGASVPPFGRSDAPPGADGGSIPGVGTVERDCSRAQRVSGPCGAEGHEGMGESTVSEQEVFLLAERALKNVIDRIRDDQWAMKMPPSFARRDGRTVTLREIVNYHAYDDAWVPAMLAGKTMDEAGKVAFEGDLLGGDPKGNFAAIVEAACAAALGLDDLERTVHCSFGDYTAREYLWQINGFRGLRTHDIARAIGVDATLPRDLVEGLWEEISPHAEEWRAIGVFGPAVAVPADADLQARLLGLTGRPPY